MLIGKEILNRNDRPIIINPVEITEDYVISQWAVNEALNPKWRWRNTNLSPELQTKLKTLQLPEIDQSLSDAEKFQIIKAFLSDPDRLGVRDIEKMKCRWIKGLIAISEIEKIYLEKFPLSDRLSPSGRLIEFVDNLGREPVVSLEDNVIINNINRIYQEFDQISFTGYPILLSQTGDHPFCAIDGISRLCATLMRKKENRLTTNTIPVIVGISDAILDWQDIPRQMENKS